jgi:hypothetical protein
MKNSEPHHRTASIRQKLLNYARKQNEDFQLVLTQYAIERFLFRLGRSKYAEDFVLKGAFLYLIWMHRPYRPTRDLDLLGFVENSSDHLRDVFKDLCDMSAADGLVFETDSLSIEQIREDLEENGVRIMLMAKLGNARIPLQIDIGFGDVVTPKPQSESYPTILEMPEPHIKAYNKESVISEKYEAMVRLGIANSRMKDFYDVWVLAKEFNYRGSILSQAIQSTFHRRKTALPESVPIALKTDFYRDTAKQSQWKAFFTRSQVGIVPDTFDGVIDFIRSFLMPPTEALRQNRSFQLMWTAGGSWR